MLPKKPLRKCIYEARIVMVKTVKWRHEEACRKTVSQGRVRYRNRKLISTLTTSRPSAVDILTSLFFLRSISILYSHLIHISQFYVACKRIKITSWKIFIFYTTTHLITPVNIIFPTRTLIWVSYVFIHTEFKYVIRTSLSPTVFVTQKALKCNFSEFRFFVTLLVCFKYGWALYYISNTVWAWTLNHKNSRHVSPITDNKTMQVRPVPTRWGKKLTVSSAWGTLHC